MQKIDKNVFIDAALRLLKKYSAASITYSEIIRESGHSRRAFYYSIDVDNMWHDVIQKLSEGDSMSYVYVREDRCDRKISKKIARLIREKLKEKGDI